MSERKLKNLKKEYENLKEKYGLPSFDELNKNFEIEKLQDRERNYLLRDIRRTLVEKDISYFKFLEMFLNPGSGPMFFMALTNNLNAEEKNKIEDIYFKLGKFELDSVSLDNDSTEKEEAEFIKSFFEEWKNLKSDFGELMESIEEVWEREVEKGDKGYLG